VAAGALRKQVLELAHHAWRVIAGIAQVNPMSHRATVVEIEPQIAAQLTHRELASWDQRAETAGGGTWTELSRQLRTRQIDSRDVEVTPVVEPQIDRQEPSPGKVAVPAKPEMIVEICQPLDEDVLCSRWVAVVVH
jgi:hypothetical protein